MLLLDAFGVRHYYAWIAIVNGDRVGRFGRAQIDGRLFVALFDGEHAEDTIVYVTL